jgi:transposase
VERQYVAIDLHARRSLIVRQNDAGEELGVVRIDNDPVALSLALAEAGPDPEVAIEATYGWYWAVDVLQAEGARVHLVHPSGLDWTGRRVKNDYRDCRDLLDRLRIGRLPEAWIAPPPVRELRELVRHRAKLVALRTGLKAQVKAVLAKHGVYPPVGDLWGPVGTEYLDELSLERSYALKLGSLRALVGRYDGEVALLEREIHTWLRDDAGYWAIQAVDGIGKTLAAILVAEIGDISRFPGPQQLCSWAGLTPKHRESDSKVQRGHITKQGSTLVRWAAIEAISRVRGTPKMKADYLRIGQRRGKNIARVAMARKLLCLVYYGLRDGEIRCLARADQAE